MTENPTTSETERLQVFRQKHATGLVTLLFTDVVDSTGLKQQLGEHAGQALLARHQALVRECLKQFPTGQEISVAGDSFFLVFAVPSEAVTFSLLLIARLRDLAREIGLPLNDRIGIHLGEVVFDLPGNQHPADLHSVQIDICSRVMSMAQAGQILLTRPVFDNARQVLKGEDIAGLGPLAWANHGAYELKGIEDAVEICEVGEQRRFPFVPPPSTEKSRRRVAVDAEVVLGWRPAVGQLVPKTKWRLERQLGTGGFGEVWLARHETLKERRVFKFCFRTDRVRALRREVTLFRLLRERLGDHQHIVAIREVFFDEPPFYVVMDYADGGDLRSWCEVQGGVAKVPEELRLELMAQAAEALHAAHQAGVVHRDIKPGNILIAESAPNRASPLVKLTDFGIGQVAAKELLEQITRAGFTETMAGAGSSNQTGTYLYMAPEVLAGQPADFRSDIYSLGVVLFQVIVGDFTRPLTMDWVKHVNDPLLREDLLKCFAGNPAERFSSAGELARQLRAMEERRASQAAAEAAVERKKKRAYLAGLLRQAGLAVLILALFASGALLFKDYRAGRYGSVEIRSIPSGAEVWQNNVRLGVTPYIATDLAPGPFSCTINLLGYEPLVTAIEVSPRKQTQLVSFLSRAPAPEVASVPPPPGPAPNGDTGLTNSAAFLAALETAKASMRRDSRPSAQTPPLGFHASETMEITAEVSNRVAVASIEGRVEFLPRGAREWQPATAHLVLASGDCLRTGRRSRATLRLSDQSIMQLAELTTLEVKPAGGFNLHGKVAPGATNIIRLPAGIVQIRG